MSAHPPQPEALPPQPTPFLGRRREVAALRAMLGDPACRLVTLAGPGGIGKTRLAVELAAQVQGSFADGVAFVALQPVASAAFLASALGDALRLSLEGEGRGQLLQALRGRQMLLVLDNFEHLLDGAGLLLEIVRAAPEVTLLVTSREVLNVREEWLFPVGELDLPGEGEGADPMGSSAVQLFVACARRVRPGFEPGAEAAEVARICRLVAGMPLAIELAAAWTKTLPCATIAAEIARNLAFLEAGVRDLPERHRSVRAAFDQSWRLLGPDEQTLFRRLAVFRGGFTYEAAARVAGAAPPVLAALVDKSLARLDGGGRYQVHELLRQYAEGHLAADPEELAAAQRAHAGHYLGGLSRLGDELFRDSAALDAVAAELGNVRAAWQWAATQADVRALGRAAYPLWAYFHQRGPVGDGIAALEQALGALAPGPADGEAGAARAQLLVQLGWLAVRQGDLGRAQARFEASRALFERWGLAPPAGYATDPLLGLARLALWGGQYAETWRLAEAARRRGEAGRHESNRAIARYLQAGAARMQGRQRIAQRLAREALAAAERLRNDWIKAYCLEELGRVAQLRDAHEQAERYFQACYDLRTGRGDALGAAIASDQLGATMLRRGALVEARRLYEGSAAALRRLGNRDTLASSLNGLAMVAAAQGDYEQARRALTEACLIAAEISYGAILPALLASVADLLIRLGRREQAAELLTFILRHAASADDTFALAQRLILACEAALAPGALAAAVARGQALDVDGAFALAHEVLATRLAAPGAAPAAPRHGEPPAAAPPGPDGEPAERLTPRELEVLRLIGEGLSNQTIADRLVLSYGTVRWYTQQIYGKLGVQSRTQALARARSLNLLG